jgi:hypothetical protein
MPNLRYDTFKTHNRASKELHKTSNIQGYEIMIEMLIMTLGECVLVFILSLWAYESVKI